MLGTKYKQVNKYTHTDVVGFFLYYLEMQVLLSKLSKLSLVNLVISLFQK